MLSEEERKGWFEGKVGKSKCYLVMFGDCFPRSSVQNLEVTQLPVCNVYQ